MAEPRDEILTVSEIAERLRVPNSWVYGHADLLGAYRLGKYLRFSWKRTLQCLEAGSHNEGLGAAAQRPSGEATNSEVYRTHGTAREQKRLDN